jgi:hypothetical protein
LIGREVLGVDAHHGEVVQRVAADDLGVDDVTAGEPHAEGLGVLDDVVVGEDVAVLAVDDAGAEAPTAAPRRRADPGSPSRPRGRRC